MKHLSLFLITIIFLSCNSSTEEQIRGVWDSSYSTDELTTSTTTHFHKNYVYEMGTMSSKQGNFSCKFKFRGSYFINDKMLSIKYEDISLYQGNSDYIMSRMRKGFEKLKFQTYSYELISIDSKTMIVKDLDTKKVITYIKVGEKDDVKLL